MRFALIPALLLVLSACNFFTPPGAQETLSADYAARGTQIADLRLTATVEMDRLFVTQEAIQTAVRDVELQSTRTSATLVALGTAVIDTSAITPAGDVALAAAPQPTALAITPGSAAASAGAGGAPQPTPVAVATQAAPADPNATLLTNIVTTESIGADNCAAAPNSSFTSSTSGVYIVATAFNLTPNNTITYRWQRDSIEVYVATWSPSGNTNGECIWYYVTPAEVAFEPGSWSVEVLIDGVLVGSPIPFTVSG
jgi:hypothetical protein